MSLLQISKIFLQNEWRIGIKSEYDQVIISKIKLLPDARWSNSMKLWHIPYTNEAYRQLKNQFIEMEIIQNNDRSKI